MVRAVVTAADQREVAPWVTVTTFTFTASARTPSARSIKPTAPPIDSTRRIRFRWNIYAMWRINRRVGCPRACGSLAKLMPISGRFNASSTVPATSAVTRAPGKNWKTIEQFRPGVRSPFMGSRASICVRFPGILRGWSWSVKPNVRPQEFGMAVHHRLERPDAISVFAPRKKSHRSRILIAHKHQILDLLLVQKGQKGLAIAWRVEGSQKLVGRNSGQSLHRSFITEDARVRVRLEVGVKINGDSALSGDLVEQPDRTNKFNARIEGEDRDH